VTLEQWFCIWMEHLTRCDRRQCGLVCVCVSVFCFWRLIRVYDVFQVSSVLRKCFGIDQDLSCAADYNQLSADQETIDVHCPYDWCLQCDLELWTIWLLVRIIRNFLRTRQTILVRTIRVSPLTMNLALFKMWFTLLSADQGCVIGEANVGRCLMTELLLW
jgi:hypothetical protein